MRSRAEIDEVLNAAADGEHASRWPGMTYEAGVANALRWVTEDDDTDPMAD